MVKGGKKRQQKDQERKMGQRRGKEQIVQREIIIGKMVEKKRKVGLKDEEGAAKGNAKEAVTEGD